MNQYEPVFQPLVFTLEAHLGSPEMVWAVLVEGKIVVEEKAKGLLFSSQVRESFQETLVGQSIVLRCILTTCLTGRGEKDTVPFRDFSNVFTAQGVYCPPWVAPLLLLRWFDQPFLSVDVAMEPVEGLIFGVRRAINGKTLYVRDPQRVYLGSELWMISER